LEARFVEPGDPAWTRFLSKVPHDVYHLPGYVAVEAARVDGEAGALIVEAGDRGLLIPLVLRPLPHGVVGKDAASPYGYPGPVFTAEAQADPAFVRSSGRAAIAVLAGKSCCSAFIRAHPLLPQAADMFGARANHRQIGPTVWVDLKRPAEERWANMDPKIRGTIRRTYRHGFEVHIDEDWDALLTFVDIYESTMDRVDAAEHYYFDCAYFESLRAALGEQIQLLVVRYEDEIVGASLFTEVEGTVQYHLSGSKRLRGRSPSAVMLDHACRWAEERGNSRLHLGGGLGATEDGLFRFKSGFSERRGSYAVWDVVVDQEMFDLACSRTPALQSGDQLESGFFPPYRLT
jgi:hypothetical protein